MKAILSAQLGQHLHLTPQLLQSIRLLQLNGLELEMEIQRALDNNPLLEIEDAPEDRIDSAAAEGAAQDTAAFDELPESNLWDVPGASWQDGDDDRMARIAEGHSTDPHVRVLRELALELDPRSLAVAAFWLEHCDDAGYLDAPLDGLQQRASVLHELPAARVEAIRQRLLHGDPAGLAATDPGECLRAQLAALPGRVPARHLAMRILAGPLERLATHDYAGLATASMPSLTMSARRCA